MRSSLHRLGAALALSTMAVMTRPAPALSQQDGPEYRLFACAVTCLYYALNGQCNTRTNQQCVAWYGGCVEGCMFTI